MSSHDIFDDSMSSTKSHEKFLSNGKEKRWLIRMQFQKESFVVKQDGEDADYLMLKSALEMENRSECVVVGAEESSSW